MEQFTLLLPIDEISNVSEIMIDAISKGDTINLQRAGNEVRICFNALIEKVNQKSEQQWSDLLQVN